MKTLESIMKSKEFKSIKNWRVSEKYSNTVACISFWGSILVLAGAAAASNFGVCILALAALAGGLWISGAYDEK